MNDLQHLGSIKDVISRYDLSPKKSLGQNFILNPDVLTKIARLVPDIERQEIIEIGPGPGGLTRALLTLGAKKVTAIEMDRRCFPALDELAHAVDGRLHIIEGDALKINLQERLPEARVVVANLPYYISTRLLTLWCSYLSHFDAFVLMFQKEVAQRICAQRGHKEYGRLSILVQALAKTQVAFDLPPGVFTPPPKVTSSIVLIKPFKTPPYPLDLVWLQKITQHAFGQRRKMLKTSLKGLTPDIMNVLEKLSIDSTKRGEALSIEDYCHLSWALKNPTS